MTPKPSKPQPEYIRLRDVPAEIEKMNGTKPHVGTIHRWHQHGIRGVRLQTRLMGECRFTTLEWLNEFFDASDNYEGPPSKAAKPGNKPVAKPKRTPSEAARIARAKAESKRLGV